MFLHVANIKDILQHCSTFIIYRSRFNIATIQHMYNSNHYTLHKIITASYIVCAKFCNLGNAVIGTFQVATIKCSVHCNRPIVSASSSCQ